ncbi:FkbM family methyltransferase [Acinetobacter sp. AOR15_HL]|uniref:FkbM family methyltransferase n=1 Tax=unclassified Acinetobacter TaxID=196816 RepID=UPI0022EA4867|nr:MULTISPECIES: FkbM family methyltransferase [unclassified Acinetobacter]MDA3556158.1 FkbM family methyltransferase [Acinetobacter sp. AOR15_HL]MDA3571615.1 FkbM family methyltransferase [Acinetobacter sp. AOR14_HL]
MNLNLIFDIGMHDGTDTDFYLRKGFKVVAIEANNDLCDLAREKFKNQIESDQLVVINAIVGSDQDEMTLFKNIKNTQWSTTKKSWLDRNNQMGALSVQENVRCIKLLELIKEYGCPYYIKIDIEGSDYDALLDLKESNELPYFISFELSKFSIWNVVNEFKLINELGYKNFKLIPQHLVHQQKPPYPSLEGCYADPYFNWASSGLFGRELPNSWLGIRFAFIKYIPVIIRHHLVGDYAKANFPKISYLLRKILGKPGWHDLHACRKNFYTEDIK